MCGVTGAFNRRQHRYSARHRALLLIMAFAFGSISGRWLHTIALSSFKASRLGGRRLSVAVEQYEPQSMIMVCRRRMQY